MNNSKLSELKNIYNIMGGSPNHQEVLFKQKGDAEMILAYHTVGNGICFGGVRLVDPDDKEAAIEDALRLSEAMTYKLALINTPYGGCKATVLLPDSGKTEEFLHDIGELIEEERGKFISAIDFGFKPEDAKVIRERTNYIFAIKDSEFGQSGVSTAHGVMVGIKASLKQVFDSDVIKGKSFAVQGLGSVGSVLAKILINEGGKVYVSDTDEKMSAEFQDIATIVSPDEILRLNVDVLAPCGPAYVFNKDSIPKLNCKVIAGGANCQLKDEAEDDSRLKERGILIAPDYVINAGGVIQGIEELNGNSLSDAIAKLPIIGDNLTKIYSEAEKNDEGPYSVAKRIVLENKIRGQLCR
jgi:leucine dehydrogenase